MSAAYDAHVAEMMRPQMLESAESRPSELGLLEGFPVRQDFTDLQSYVDALEKHSGVETEWRLLVSGEAVTLWPPEEASSSNSDYESISRLLAVLMYAGLTQSLQFGFVGNESVRTGD